jgi:Fic family protein
MIFEEPTLGSKDEAVLDIIREQRETLKIYTQINPRRWYGSLRRSTFARAIQGSNSIEGYNATIDEAIAAVDEEPPFDERTETWFAINGYRQAMTYIIQAAADPYFEFSKQFLKSLHFMMTSFDLNAFPGQWRPGTVYVVNRRTADVVYEAPDKNLVDPLVVELVQYLEDGSHKSSRVKAAMAHLNLTMIHPFKDGNGRIARALQTLMLAREGIIHPLFSSIEEWLGKNTDEYYAVLAEVGQGSWNPGNDTLPWIQFCLKAHYQQAAVLIRRHDEYENLFGIIDRITTREGLHTRTAVPLFECALGTRLTNSRYQKGAEVSSYVATRELKQLSDIGLLEPVGERRGRYYIAGKELSEAREKVRIKKIVQNPYDLTLPVREEPRLPGV